eukprot:scaffold37932_cov68-Phaeocystis_antarctica.AAC.2
MRRAASSGRPTPSTSLVAAALGRLARAPRSTSASASPPRPSRFPGAAPRLVGRDKTVTQLAS